MTRLKIAQVATADSSISLLLKDQIQALQAAGHEVIAVCVPGSRVEEIREQGIPVRTIPMERELSPLRDLRSLLQLFHCFRSERFSMLSTPTPQRPVYWVRSRRRWPGFPWWSTPSMAFCTTMPFPSGNGCCSGFPRKPPPCSVTIFCPRAGRMSALRSERGFARKQDPLSWQRDRCVPLLATEFYT